MYYLAHFLLASITLRELREHWPPDAFVAAYEGLQACPFAPSLPLKAQLGWE